jgi:subtilisin family serine protease
MKNKFFSLVCVLGLLLAMIVTPARGDSFADDFIPGEVVVTLKPGRNINSFNARFGTTTLEQLTGTNTYRLRLRTGDEVVNVLDEIQADPDVQAAQPNFEFESPEIRQSGMAFLDQSGMAFLDGVSPSNYYQQSALDPLRLAQAHALSRGAGVIVAVIDTGIDFAHPLFVNKIVGPYYDFAANDLNPMDDGGGVGTGHGTFVAGLVLRAAPDARIMPLRAFNQTGRATTFTIARAIRYAASNGARIINMSFGLLNEDAVVKSAVETAAAAGAFMVAAAGNDNLEHIHYPAAHSSVLSVTSTGANDVRASFANYNTLVNVAAPGASLHSAFPGGGWAFWSGTSFSTALVAGEAAVLLAAQPFAGNAQIRTTILSSGAPLNAINPSYVDKLGSVRVDFRTALDRLPLLPATSSYDHKNGKSYFAGGSNGNEPTEDLRSLGEEFKLEIESGVNYWWQAEFADSASGAGNPSGVFVNVHYRAETGWTGTLTAQYFNGSSLVASTTLPVNSAEDPSVGKGRKGIFRWNLSSFVLTRSAVNAGRVRFINQSSNGKKVWVVYADLEAQ